MKAISFIPIPNERLVVNYSGENFLNINDIVRLGRTFSPYSVPSPWAPAIYFKYILEKGDYKQKKEIYDFIETILKGIYIGKLIITRIDFSSMIEQSKLREVDQILAVRVKGEQEPWDVVAINFPDILFFPSRFYMDLDGNFLERWEKLKGLIDRSYETKKKLSNIPEVDRPYLRLHCDETGVRLNNIIGSGLPFQVNAITTREGRTYEQIFALSENEEVIKIILNHIENLEHEEGPGVRKRRSIQSADKVKAESQKTEDYGIFVDENTKVWCFANDRLYDPDDDEVTLRKGMYSETDETESRIVFLGEDEYRIDEYIDDNLQEFSFEKYFCDYVVKLDNEEPLNFKFPMFPFKKINSVFKKFKTKWSENQEGISCSVTLHNSKGEPIWRYTKPYKYSNIINLKNKVDSKEAKKKDKRKEMSPGDFFNTIFLYIWPDFCIEGWDFYYMYIYPNMAIPGNLTGGGELKFEILGKDGKSKIILVNQQLHDNFGKHIAVSKNDLISVEIDGVNTGYFCVRQWLKHKLDEKRHAGSLSIDLGATASCASIHDSITGEVIVVDADVPSVTLHSKTAVYNLTTIPAYQNNSLIHSYVLKRFGAQSGGFFEDYNLFYFEKATKKIDMSELVKTYFKMHHSEVKWPGESVKDGVDYKEVYINLFMLLILAKVRKSGYTTIDRIKLSVPLAFSKEEVQSYRNMIEKTLSCLKDRGIDIVFDRDSKGPNIRTISENDILFFDDPGKGLHIFLDMGGGTLDISCICSLKPMEPLMVESLRVAGNQIIKWLTKNYTENQILSEFDIIYDLEEDISNVKRQITKKGKDLQRKFLRLISTFIKETLQGLNIEQKIDLFVEQAKNDDRHVEASPGDFKEYKYHLFGRGWLLFDEELLEQEFGTKLLKNHSELKTKLVETMPGIPMNEDIDSGVKTIVGLGLVNQISQVKVMDKALEIPLTEKDLAEMYGKKSDKYEGNVSILKNKTFENLKVEPENNFFKQLLHKDVIEYLGNQEGDYGAEMKKNIKASQNFLDHVNSLHKYAEIGLDDFCFKNSRQKEMVRSPLTWLINKHGGDLYLLENEIYLYEPMVYDKKYDAPFIQVLQEWGVPNWQAEREIDNLWIKGRMDNNALKIEEHSFEVLDMTSYFTKKIPDTPVLLINPFENYHLAEYFSLGINKEDLWFNLPDPGKHETATVEKVNHAALIKLKTGFSPKISEMSEEESDKLKEFADMLKENVDRFIRGSILFKRKTTQQEE